MQADVLDISPAVVWVIALTQLLTFGLTIWQLMSSPSRENGKRLDGHAARIDGLDSRLHAVEHTQRSGPTKDDMHALELALRDTRGEMQAMRATMEGRNELLSRLETIVTRHEEHLLKS